MSFDPNQSQHRTGEHQAGSPGPGQLTSEDRTWGLVAHLSALVTAYFAMGFMGPLAVMFTKGNQSQFVRAHAVEALNFQITLLIGIVAIGTFSVFTLGLAFLPLVFLSIPFAVAALIFIILAAVAANNGQMYRYPVNLRVVK